MFQTYAEIRAALACMPGADMQARNAAQERNANLTKPAGSLGQLEELGLWYATWRGQARPKIEKIQVVIFAGNHGVTAQGVSAFPAEVTHQMVANFEAGGAAVNQLAGAVGAEMSVVALDLDHPTADFTRAPAMSEAEMCAAFSAGWESVSADVDLFVAGEMGIGNTTVAAALSAAFFGGKADVWVGLGTGVDEEGLARKRAAVTAALARHEDVVASGDALAILAALGGRELAAMAGAYARARALRIPVVLDGFISCAAASVLGRLMTGGLDHTIAGHVSAEAAHRRLLSALGKTALLSLGMRLGEASGAALAVSIVKGAVGCLSGMATFAEAGVSDGE